MILRSPTHNPLGKRPLNYMVERTGMGDYPTPTYFPPPPPGMVFEGKPVIAEAWDKIHGWWYLITDPPSADMLAVLADSSTPKKIYDHARVTVLTGGVPDVPAAPISVSIQEYTPGQAVPSPLVNMTAAGYAAYMDANHPGWRNATALPAALPSFIPTSVPTAATSWFSDSTQIAGYAIPNLALLAGAGALAFMFMGGGKKGRK